MPERSKDRLATRQKILDALGRLFAKDGFTPPGVNALAREAGVNKVLIYRYFGDLSGVMREYAAGIDFWPDLYEIFTGKEAPGGVTYLTLESLPPELTAAMAEQPLAERTADTIINLAEAVRRRPVTIDIMARENVERNELTEMLDTLREQRGMELIKTIPDGPGQSKGDETAVFTMLAPMLTGSLFYLMIRKRNTRYFGGIDIQAEAGWQAMYESIRQICRTLFAVKK